MDSKSSLDQNNQNNLEPVIDSSYLPRIIKPRKRRKRERNTRNNTMTAETFLSDTFTFSVKNKISHNSSINDNNNRLNMKITAENELFFLNSFKEVPLSIVSISEQIFLSQLNSSTTSCSCHLCKPNQKIWAFSKQNDCNDFNYEIQCTSSTHDLVKQDFGPVGSDRNKKNI